MKTRQRILITGVSGYIGSCFNNYLHKNKNVYSLDKNKPNRWTKIGYKKFYKCNLLDKKKLQNVFKKIKPNIIVHLAARSTVNEKISKKEYFLNNVQATKNLISMMKKFKTEKIILSSTAAVYAKKNELIYENDKLRPNNKYGKSKLKTEKVLINSKNIKFVILRFFNVSSSISNPLIGEFHNPETHLIPIAVYRALKNKRINIFGNNYMTEDGTCIRDYIHVRDICFAIKKSILYLNKKEKKNLIVNIGNGYGVSNKEIVIKLKKILNKEININYAKRRKGDYSSLVCNVNNAKKFLKWSPYNSSIYKILKDEIKWCKFLNHKKMFRKI